LSNRSLIIICFLYSFVCYNIIYQIASYFVFFYRLKVAWGYDGHCSDQIWNKDQGRDPPRRSRTQGLHPKHDHRWNMTLFMTLFMTLQPLKYDLEIRCTLNVHLIIFSDATVWKFESRFGYQFSASRNRGFGFNFTKTILFFIFWKLKTEFAVSIRSCSSFHTAHYIVSPCSENNQNN